jgi:hypothetical protein
MSNGNDTENDNGSGTKSPPEVLLAKEPTTDGGTYQSTDFP